MGMPSARAARQRRRSYSKSQLGQRSNGSSIAALIISTPQRYVRAAQEARLAGLSPVARIAPIFANRSGCPKVTRGEYGLTLAMRKALEQAAASEIPSAIFEDDIVLTTSADAVLSYARSALQAPREYHLIQLGSCGHFGCAHALLWTPQGARRLLQLQPTPCWKGKPWDKQLRDHCLKRRLRCKGQEDLRLKVQPIRLPSEYTAEELAKGTTRNGSEHKRFFGFGHFVQDRGRVPPYLHVRGHNLGKAVGM